MKNGVQIDLIGANGAQGAVASKMAGLSVNQLRPYVGADGRSYITQYLGGDPKEPTSYRSMEIGAYAATLRRDEWIALDTAIQRIAESRLGGVQDLVSRGLVFNIGNGMGSTVLEYHDVSDALEAELSMDGIGRSKNDRPEFTSKYLPLPLIHADYEINSRVLEVSRNMGQPLDTTLAERAARKVNARVETLLFGNGSYTFGGGTIYSYMNFPNRNKVNLTKSWSASDKTAAGIIADVMLLKKASLEAHHYGPWVLYVPSGYETVLDEDYNLSLGITTRERIKQIEGIEDVKVNDTLASDNILLVQMTPDVVRMVQALALQNVEWMAEGPMIHKYKVMTIQVPQIRADQEGNCGIVHMAAGLVG